MRWLSIPLLLLAGCATSVQPQAEFRTIYLVCGQATRVDINLDSNTAVLRDTNGEQVTLKRTQSHLGTRYEGDGVSILRSGDLYVYYTRDLLALNCSPLKRTGLGA